MPEGVDEKKSITPEGEKEVSPQELAESWLHFRTGQVFKDIEAKESAIKFTRNYRPSVHSSPGEGPGSLDYSDYEVSQLEAEQWEYEKEDEIAHLEAEQYRLDDELDGLDALTKKVRAGDSELVKELALKEKERREKIEEMKRRKEERG